MNKLVQKIKELIHKLFSLKDTPHAIAGGVAIGMFMGFTPFFGLKTLLCLGAAYLLRCNPVAAVVAVSLHDVVTPLWPVLLAIEYEIGYRIVIHFYDISPKFEIHHLKLHDLAQWFQWSTFSKIGLPLLVGSMFLSIPAAFIAYFLTIGVVRRVHARQAEKTAEAESP